MSAEWRRGCVPAALLAQLVVALALFSIATQARTQTTPTFKSATNSTWVTATVFDRDGHLVSDLTRRDFEIRENGEPRDITVFRNDVVPFEVAVMLDVSLSMMNNRGAVRNGITELVTRFSPGDRAAIGRFAGSPTIPQYFSGNQKTLLSWAGLTFEYPGLPCGPDVGRPAKGGTAVWDAMECGIESLQIDSETPRRVVLVLTDGVDNGSYSSAQEVAKDADAAGVMIYVAAVSGLEGVARDELRAIASRTGGGYFEFAGADDIPAVFAEIADELRHQYLFSFTTTPNASPDTLIIHATRPGVTTRARRLNVATARAGAALQSSNVETPAGPSVPEMPARATGASAEADSPEARALLAGRLDRYERGRESVSDFPAVRSGGLFAVLTAMRRVTQEWVPANGVRSEQQRRLVAATYTLDMLSRQDPLSLMGTVRVGTSTVPDPDATMVVPRAAAGLPGGSLGPAAEDLIDWATGLVRQGLPSRGERFWYLSAISLIERLGNASALSKLADQAISRFPDEPRFVLARAVAVDLQTWPEPRDVHKFTIDASLATRLVTRLTEAAALEPVREEAELRLGAFEWRRGHPDLALQHFAKAGASRDPFVRFWLDLMNGRALEDAGRIDDAIASYRQACAVFPDAQSAVISLAAALSVNHRAEEAAMIVQRSLHAKSAAYDPWALFPTPEWRLWQLYMPELRKLVAP